MYPGGTQEAPRGTQVAPMSTQEAPREHPGGTQEAPRGTQEPRGGSEGKSSKTYVSVSGVNEQNKTNVGDLVF